MQKNSLKKIQVSTHVRPIFNANTAHSYFSSTYQSTSPHFKTPYWMQSPSPPTSQSMEMTPVTEEELLRVIGKSRSSSAPFPVDGIPYVVFKRCPSLHKPLLDLFNRVIMEGEVPSSWKRAT